MYKTKFWDKFTEEDIFADGCQPRTNNQTQHYGEDEFSNKTLEGLIKELMEFCKVTSKENVLLNSCDESGRVDIQRMETEKGRVATKSDIERWKKGELRLWDACFVFTILEEREANFRSLKGQGFSEDYL